MNPILKAALDEVDRHTSAGGNPLALMREKRRLLKTATEAVLSAATHESRDLLQSEARDFDVAKSRLEEVSERIDELEKQEVRENAAAATRIASRSPIGGWSVFGEPDVYMDPLVNPGGPSFFADMVRSQRGDWAAAERLSRCQEGKTLERRALGNTGAVGGSGGELAPPAWLENEFITLARPGRVFADLATRMPLPEHVSSVNIPRELSGTSTAIQSTQNTALSQTDMTTGALTSAITTIGGKQVVSQQLLDQSAVPIDRVVLQDLASDYAKQLGNQFISGTGTGTGGQLRGVLNGASLVTTPYTTASPSVVSTTGANSFLNRVIAAKVTIATTRFLPANALLLHPRRWGWIQEALDGNGRPLISPVDAPSGQPQPGTDDQTVAQGAVGTFGGLAVYVDASLPITYNSTTQDVAIVCRVEDLYFWESPIQLETFRQPYADSMGVLFRVFAYSAAIPDRYPSSVNVITGTGMVAPSL